MLLSVETMKWRLQHGEYAEFDLVFYEGTGRVVEATDQKLGLQVRGKRADYTWDRLLNAWRRLQQNHVLTVDELGGGHDAVGLVSLFAAMEPTALDVVPADGLIRLRKREGKPVRSHPGAMLPRSWNPLRRKISGH